MTVRPSASEFAGHVGDGTGRGDDGASALLGRDPGLTLNFISFLDFGLLLLAYPLLRMPPEANASAPVSPMIRRESAA